MVQVTTTVEADRVRQGDSFRKVADCSGFSLLLEETVEVLDVGAMVLAVVEVKEEATHDGLKRSNLEGEMLQLHTGGGGNSSTQVLFDKVVDHFSRSLIKTDYATLKIKGIHQSSCFLATDCIPKKTSKIFHQIFSL